MKTAFGMAFVVLALGITSVTAQTQSSGVPELSKGLSNPTAGPTPEPAAAPAPNMVAATADNGAMPGDSHVRIVRLSEVNGSLALDRQTGLGFEQTMQNMPIVQGEKLQTAEGYAEVEFEDNSTLRLAPNSQVDFPLLVLRSSGAKASTMNVVKGTVYVSTENTKGNEFLLVAGETKMTVAPSTHLRVEVNESRTVVSVFNGSVEVQHGAETSVVGKKETLTLNGSEAVVAKKVAGEPYDAWDKESIDYHTRYSNANTFAGGGNAFGLSDLNYYGNFINAGGATFWQPYLVGAGWNPYGNGVWAFYPGAGYSWVSPYPWGWLPYHSGTWSFFPGYGWGWQPGGAWNGLNNIAGNGFGTGTGPGTGMGAGTGIGAGAGTAGGTLTKNTMHAPLRPSAPAVAAGGARPSLVLSNQKPMVFSREDRPGNFVFQRDSAGLGVPRGSLGNLNHVSNDVGRHGSASMPVYAATPNGGMEGNNSHGASRGPVSLRAGSPGEGAQGWRGNEGSSGESRHGAYEGNRGGQGASGASGAQPSSRGGGGGSAGGGMQPGAPSASGPAGNGGGRQSAPAPK